MRIEIDAVTKYEDKTYIIDLEDIDFTEETWKMLSRSEKEAVLREECKNIREPIRWTLNGYKEIKD